MPPATLGDDGYLHCRLTELLEERGMSLNRLSESVGITIANLSILKNDHAKAIRFSTLVAICQALDCEVGDLFVIHPEPPMAAIGKRKRQSR